MKLRLFAALVLLPLAASADTLYKCTDESGQVLYTNQKGASKSCTVLSREQPISTFAPPPKTRPSDFPRVNADQQKARDSDRRAILQQELANEQKQLDEARKALTEQEGRFEPTERNAGGGINGAKVQERVQPYRDSVQLHERNIEALNREIGNLK
jgi:multidrug resistance efflux pump